MPHLVELQPDHLDELSDFCNRNFEFHQGQFEKEILQNRIFEDPDYELEHGFFLREKGQTVGFMVGVLRGNDAWLKLFAVDREHHRTGFGRMMLAEIEDLFRLSGATYVHVLNASPYYLMPGLDPRYTEALCFLQSHGYTFNRYVHNMAVDLTADDFDTTQAESKLARTGIKVRRLKREEEQTFYEWMLATWSTNWTTESCNSLKNTPVTTFLALDQDNNICGFASYDVTMFRGGFGPTGVEERMRGLGLGKILLLRCLRDMKDRGYRRSEIGWVGPISFYTHTVGARICATFMQGSKAL
ncbi:MAG: GNAT family N-acetyltransferase [Candidatus Poribacteria bacterium]|nr:GNAT family N-acetyltransferase [Candidatus Poribacteria bacterium]